MGSHGGFWLVVIMGIIYLQSEYLVRGDAAMTITSAEEVRPFRPRVFTTPEELRQYLDALSKYYALAGRPRFGKRALPVKDASSIKPAVPNLSFQEMYDFLQNEK